MTNSSPAAEPAFAASRQWAGLKRDIPAASAPTLGGASPAVSPPPSAFDATTGKPRGIAWDPTLGRSVRGAAPPPAPQPVRLSVKARAALAVRRVEESARIERRLELAEDHVANALAASATKADDPDETAKEFAHAQSLIDGARSRAETNVREQDRQQSKRVAADDSMRLGEAARVDAQRRT